MNSIWASENYVGYVAWHHVRLVSDIQLSDGTTLRAGASGECAINLAESGVNLLTLTSSKELVEVVGYMKLMHAVAEIYTSEELQCVENLVEGIIVSLPLAQQCQKRFA